MINGFKVTGKAISCVFLISKICSSVFSSRNLLHFLFKLDTSPLLHKILYLIFLKEAFKNKTSYILNVLGLFVIDYFTLVRTTYAFNVYFFL